ncbi:hypothetical protein Gocc_0087 [Gaiella occulta]|uniref:Bacterial extracellular solute-binding protein, family 5 Middle n=1 Tax=Gaiella occulta TaxID=1002870 RepID=A0A7M2YZW1_9ACTN|nr:hypothetical protein [Gaiella occulta]RDI75668.1 hypothetical protein Gocc_0087 [Gaiella occulta]
MRYVRLALLAAAAVTLLSGSALAQSTTSLGPPQGLKPFLLRASEPAIHVFPRTPSFSWAPVRGAYRYEFQLSKTAAFQDGSIFWASSGLRGPAVALPVTLPWMTGAPYAAYARVRAVTSRGVTAWSRPYGFNLEWTDVPKQVSTYPGMLQWTPVEGATSYQVWLPSINRKFESRTTAADEREIYAFRTAPLGPVVWRVRAVRRVDPARVALNHLPPVSYGPWSPRYTATNPTLAGGVVRPLASVSAAATSTSSVVRAHEMTPAFVFSGTADASGARHTLFRVYVFSDARCVNTVFTGAVVGGQSYVPRRAGTLALPTDPKALAAAATTTIAVGDEPKPTTVDGAPVKPTEALVPVAAGGATSSSSSSSSSTAAGAGSDATSAGTPLPTISGWPPIDLLESGWPNGRFYWTVVPVAPVPTFDDTGTISAYTYSDVELPQDACAAGRVLQFGKVSSPAVAGQGTPFASGLSPTGRLVASSGANSVFHGAPLVAWKPVPGAETYQVEWSRTRYPWRAIKRIDVTGGTAVSLPLKTGSWWYRVRGVDPAMPAGRQAMTWSAPLRLTVAKPKFRLIASSR